MIYTTIIHPVRELLGISPYAYFVADIIAKSQANPLYSSDGWCTLSWSRISGYIGISKVAVINAQNRLVEQGILETDGKKKRVTNIWHAAFDSVKIVYRNDGNGKESLPIEKNGTVKKVYRERSTKFTEIGKESLPLNIIKEININSSSFLREEEEKGGEFISENDVTDFDDAVVEEVSSKKKKIAAKKKKVDVFNFDESPIADVSFFKSSFRDTDYQFADLDYYHNQVRVWGMDKGVELSTNRWLSTAMKFIRRDTENGKLIRRPDLNQNKNEKRKPGIDPEQIYRIVNADRELRH